MRAQDLDQLEAEVERRVQDRVAKLLDSNTMLPEMIASSVERALRRVMSDSELTHRFWQSGYEELVEQASNNASQWVGRRLLTAFVIAAVTAGIVWLVKTGGIK